MYKTRRAPSLPWSMRSPINWLVIAGAAVLALAAVVFVPRPEFVAPLESAMYEPCDMARKFIARKVRYTAPEYINCVSGETTHRRVGEATFQIAGHYRIYSAPDRMAIPWSATLSRITPEKYLLHELIADGEMIVPRD